MKKHNIIFDEATKTLIKTEQIDTEDASSVKEIKDSLNIELIMIVRQVKSLKRRAEEIKTILYKLEEKAGSIDPAPVVEIEGTQLSSAVEFHPK